jgi:hypothetical protein
MQKVEVDKTLLISLACAAAAAILGLVFLLGRESGRAAKPPGAPAPVMPPQVITAPVPDPAGVLALDERSTPDTPTPVQGLAVVHPLQKGAPAEPAGESVRALVLAYFDAIDHIQAGGMNGDPESTAQGIMGSLAKGDSSGFDGMIQQAEATRGRLAAISPPQPCATYHRECLASLDDGLVLMRSLKTAMAGQGAEGQLTSLAAQAEVLRKRSESLRTEEQALRRLYRVPVKP